MAGTIKFFDEMQNASNVSGQDKMMIGKAESGETQVITFDQAKQYLDITSNEIAPIVGGDSEANATPVPAGPAGQTRRADVAPGWIDFGSGPIEAAATNRWMAYWDGSSWSLVDMGELPTGSIKEWTPGTYNEGDVRLYKNYVYRAKVGTSETPTGFDWQQLGGVAEAIHDQSSNINFNGSSNELEVSGTLVIVSGVNRYRANEPFSLALIQDEPAVLYIVPDSSTSGVIGTIATQDIGGIPSGAIVFCSYVRTAPNYYSVNGLNRYSVNGINRGLNTTYTGIRSGFQSGINFDTVENKVKTSSTNIIVSGNKRITLSPQSQEIDMATSGIHVLYVSQEGVLGSINQTNVSAIPLDSVIIGTYQRTSANVVLVFGIDNYSINGVDARHLNKGFGRIVSNGKDINLNGQTLEIRGSANLFVGRSRYGISQQSVDFSSSPSVFFYSPSTGEVGTSTTGDMVMPADAIIFGGHTGVRRGRAFEIWGIDNYMVKDLIAKDWQYKIVQKKFLTDFDPTPHYYISDTTLSMTDDDPETLIGSDPTIITDRYESLMTQFPHLITKEVIATIPTYNGLKDISVYTFTPPSVSTAPRPDGGKIVVEQPHVLIVTGLHGIEKTAPIANYQFFEDILYKWEDNKILEWFRFNIKMSIIPVANPAGWVNGTRPNGNGVDLNRNFPFLYIPNQNAGDTTWSGLEALDQPESLAINTWMEEHKSGLMMGIDFHNFFQTDESSPAIMWTEGVSQFSNQLGRIAAQRVSRGSRNSSPFFPSDYDELLGISSYVSTTRGRLGGQMNDILPHGFTFEISQNFRFNPNYKPNDNDAIRIGTEAWGNALTLFIWHCMQDYNAKEVTYDSL